jgi:hypothetical protein
MSRPYLSTGATRVLDAGRYYQYVVLSLHLASNTNNLVQCSTCDRPVWITDRLDPDVLFGTEPLANYFALRNKVLPTPRSKKHSTTSDDGATSATQNIARNDATTRTDAKNSATGSSQNAFPVIRMRPESPSTSSHVDSLLDKSLPVTIMVWTEVNDVLLIY